MPISFETGYMLCVYLCWFSHEKLQEKETKQNEQKIPLHNRECWSVVWAAHKDVFLVRGRTPNRVFFKLSQYTYTVECMKVYVCVCVFGAHSNPNVYSSSEIKQNDRLHQLSRLHRRMRTCIALCFSIKFGLIINENNNATSCFSSNKSSEKID